MTSPLQQVTLDEWSTRSNADIGKAYGSTPSAVAQFRRKYGKPKGPRSPGSGRPVRFNLSLIDWRLSNAENAQKIGCTPCYIGLLRRNQNQEDFA